MNKPVKFRWVKRPRKLVENLEEVSEKLLVAISAVAGMWGLSVQNEARIRAKWENPTGNARGGLFFAVDGFGQPTIIGQVKPEALRLKTDTATVSGSKERLVITLGHTVFYGKFLELNSRYAIVMSTLESNLGRLESMMRGLLK